MKRVEQLIEELQKLPPEAPVYLGGRREPVLTYHPAGYVYIDWESW